MAVRGAIAGCLATIPMTMVMRLLQRQSVHLRSSPMPPRKITRKSAHAVGLRVKKDAPTETALTALAHFTYGAAAGTSYEKLLPYAGRPNIATGAAYGLGVWAVNYLGLLPALRLNPPPSEEVRDRTTTMVASHLVWGAALGILMRRLPTWGRRRQIVRLDLPKIT